MQGKSFCVRYEKEFSIKVSKSPMHLEYFAQLFTLLTFCRNVSYSAGLDFFTTELQLRVRNYVLSSEPKVHGSTIEYVEVFFKLLESDWILINIIS